MNNITIAGQLGRDAEIRSAANGDAIANFSIADNQAGKDKPAIWWRCSLYGKRAEALGQYLKKGTALTVSGQVTERQYEKDGQQKTAQEVRVSDIALQSRREQPADSAPPQQARNAPPAKSATGFDNMDDDIPF
jgi:single-strand DNA-binding protein